MYPNEFVPEPPPPAVDPTLLAILVLAVIALVAFACWLGQFLEARGRERRARDAAKDIWTKINDAAKAAHDARGEALIGKAGDLRDEIDKHLGPARKFAAPETSEIDNLVAALEGKPHPSHEHEAGDHDEHHGASSTISIHQPRKVVIRQSQGGHEEADHGTHGDDEPKLSLRDTRSAVTAFREWWSREHERIEELQEAQAALNGSRLPK